MQLDLFVCKACSNVLSADEEVEQHQGVVLVLNVQLQVEQMAGLDLGGATVGTLQVCFQRYLVEILDFHSLKKEQEL